MASVDKTSVTEGELPLVLVIEDDESQRMLARVMIEHLGYPVVEAESGQAALDLMFHAPVSIAVSDWMMEGMSGIDLCRSVRARDLGRYIYFILVTARTSRSDLLEAMAAGADDFVTKPIDWVLLEARLRVAHRIVALEQKLRAGTEQLARAYAIIRDDLNAAASVQKELLPQQEVEYGPVRIASLFMPSQIVSGDSFNHFRLPSGEIGLYALDVAGHGTRAALLSVMLSRMLTASHFMDADRPKAPSRIVADLNRHFQAAGDDIVDYFTIICARLSADGRQLVYCQAGHPSPLLVRASGEIERLGDGGFPVGMLPDVDYEDREAVLAPGDRLVIASDGLYECMSPAGEPFAESRLEPLLLGQRSASLPALLTTLLQQLTVWHQKLGPDDDVSVLVVEVRGGEHDEV